GLGLYVVIPLLIYSLARNLLRPGLALAAAGPALVLGLPYFAFVPLAAWEGATFTLAAVVLLLLAMTASKRRSAFAFAAGNFSAVSPRSGSFFHNLRPALRWSRAFFSRGVSSPRAVKAGARVVGNRNCGPLGPAGALFSSPRDAAANV